MSTDLIPECVAVIKSIPVKGARGFMWRAHVDRVIAATVLLLKMDTAALNAVARHAGAADSLLRQFTRGLDSSNQPWPALRRGIRGAGLEPRPRPPRQPSTWRPVAEREAVLAEAHRNGRVAAAVAAEKTTTLAVDSKGQVVRAPLPHALVAPSPMVAQPGGFASKDASDAPLPTPAALTTPNVGTSTRAVKTDPATGDLLVTITTRIPYGSPEHLALSKARAAACAAKAA